MKREHKLLGLFVLGLFVVSLISGFTSAQADILDPVRSLFTFATQNAISENVAKFLFIILLTLLVGSILDTIGFIPSGGIRWTISIIVGFLGVAYLTPNEIWATLTSYNALGLTLLFLFPFVIMLFFTFRMIRTGGATGVVTQYIVWVIYFIFLIYRIINGFVLGQLNTKDPAGWVFLTAVIVTGLMVFGNRMIRRWLGEEFISEEIRAAEETERRAAAITEARAET